MFMLQSLKPFLCIYIGRSWNTKPSIVFFFLADTPPPPYNARETSRSHNGCPVHAVIESPLVLSLPNGGKSTNGEPESL